MRKAAVLLVVASLALVILQPAQAKKPGKSPVPTTLYLHGSSLSGEADSAPGLIDLVSFMKMDATAPTGSEPRSKGYVWTNYACAGNRLHPVWLGDMSGTIVGDITLTFTSVSVPQSIDVRIWPDVFAQTCNADYPDPVAEATIEVPAGRGVVEIVIPNKSFIAHQGLMIQLSPTNIVTDAPGLGRVFYDSTDADSRIEFSCVPLKGRACAK
jgi:hypothetical protein